MLKTWDQRKVLILCYELIDYILCTRFNWNERRKRHKCKRAKRTFRVQSGASSDHLESWNNVVVDVWGLLLHKSLNCKGGGNGDGDGTTVLKASPALKRREGDCSKEKLNNWICLSRRKWERERERRRRRKEISTGRQTECDQTLKYRVAIFSKSCPKSNYSSLYMKIDVFKSAKKANTHLVYFCKKTFHLEL